MRLVLSGDAARAIRAHARATAPDECCGLLVGTPDRIERVVPVRNLRASPNRYLVDPAEHFAARRAARREGLAVVGAYHSHPGGPAAPSVVDLAEAFETGFLSVIVVPGDSDEAGELAAFRFTGSGFDKVGLVVRHRRRA